MATREEAKVPLAQATSENLKDPDPPGRISPRSTLGDLRAALGIIKGRSRQGWEIGVMVAYAVFTQVEFHNIEIVP